MLTTIFQSSGTIRFQKTIPKEEGKMKRVLMNLIPLVVLCVGAANLGAQSTGQGSGTGEIRGPTAVSYVVNDGKTKIDLQGTGVIPEAKGEAKVEAKEGATFVEAKVEHLVQPGEIDKAFLTYVLWAVSPDGRSTNLGEILIDKKGKGELKATTQMQTFSLFVTSEPYHSVRMPSEIVVLTNEMRKDTKGKLVSVDTYRFMHRSQYQLQGSTTLPSDFKTVPLQMYEARNSVAIAKSHGADKYAPEIYSKAESSLTNTERLLQQEANKKNRKEIITAARQTEQHSEDARALAAVRREEERIVMERQAAVDQARRETLALAAADIAAITARDAGAIAVVKADARAVENIEARDAVDAVAIGAAAGVEAVRRQLLRQLALVLEARDTPGGIVITMADVNFDTGKYNLRPETRQKLAKMTGILVTQPGLEIVVEGYTDTTGSPRLNQVLSEERAKAVATFLMEQGMSANNVKSRGLGSSNPVADNSTAKGRQKNRRVDIIVSGEVIGRTIGPSSSSGSE